MRVLLAPLLLLVLASRVDAAVVSCDAPDNLCTGDPCVIETLTVVTPCEVDFGLRTLEIAGTVTVPDGGTLSLAASTIRLTGKLDGRNLNNGIGASVTLDGNMVELDGAIDVGGTTGGGSVVLTAGNLMPRGKIRATSKLGPGGTVALSGGSFNVPNTIDVRGASGGSIEIQGGFVQVGFKALDARGLAGPGGSVTLSVTDVTVFGNVDLRGKGGDGGMLTWTGRAHFTRKVDVSGARGDYRKNTRARQDWKRRHPHRLVATSDGMLREHRIHESEARLPGCPRRRPHRSAWGLDSICIRPSRPRHLAVPCRRRVEPRGGSNHTQRHDASARDRRKLRRPRFGCC